MSKALKKLVCLGFAVVLMVSSTLLSYATTVNHTFDLTESLAKASFTYGNGGNLLQLRIDYTEVHTQTGHENIDYVYNSANGMNNTVGTHKSADIGYVFTIASSTAYLGTAVYNVISDVRP